MVAVDSSNTVLSTLANKNLNTGETYQC